MAHTSEIEKLEQRWRDNPQSRHFAPLADAYRKSGQFDRAIEVLTAGLEQHPAYASAHIVLGRTRIDMGQPAEAEAAFRRVLELDGENVIAIRALADLSAASDRLDEAEHWLNYLLSIDAGNDDARDQLDEVAERRSQQLMVPDEAGAEPGSPDAAAAGAGEEITAERDPESVAPSLSEAEPGAEPELDAVVVDDVQEADTLQFVVPRTEEQAGEIAPEEALHLESSADQLAPEAEGLADEGVEAAGDGVEPDMDIWAESLEAPVAPFEIGVERQEDIVLRPSSSTEFQAPDASQELSAADAEAAAQAASGPPDLPAWASEDRWGEDEWRTAAGPAADPEPEPAADAGTGWAEPVQADPVDAEAYVSAPWEDDAGAAPTWDSLTDPGALAGDGAGEGTDLPDGEADAWAEPPASAAPAPEPEPLPPVAAEPEAAPRAGERAVRPAAAESEAAGRRHLEDERAAAGAPMTEPELVVTQSMGDVYAAQGHRREALQVYQQLLQRSPGDAALQRKIASLSEPVVPPPPPVAHAASDTGGRSVRDYFQGLLARPGRDAGAGVAEREEGQDGGGPSAPDEAFAGESTVSGAPTRPAAEPISLSDIFGEDSSPVPPVVPAGDEGEESHGLSFDEFFGETPPPRPEAKPRPRTVRLSQAEQDDLEQFHNWLKSLKR